ncbi:hypothetical protein IWW39_000657 [Coemansia spiralis]|uniref:P-loop containing nucleoside triphosphate hydrolase protein n=1 Tax=Coemansia spiralis TaxID=417178 RepID=A0A9W8GRS0_9FUNG|nr:hypothetical protein IWW39_000657 [Coemansia spiralis]
MSGFLWTTSPHWAARMAWTVLRVLGVSAIFSGVLSRIDFFRSTPVVCPVHELGSDCYRLGVVWPVLNLSLVVFLVIGGGAGWWWRRQQVDHNSGARALLKYKDNRRRMGMAAIIVSTVGIGIATNAAVASGLGFEQAYWQSQQVFWGYLCLAHALLGAHWTVAVAVLVQLLASSLVEPFFAFFTGQHIYEPLLATTHSRSVLAAAVVSAVAALVLLSTHRRGTFLPGDSEEGRHELAEVEEYRTPLSRVRLDQEPQAVTPERAFSVLDTLLFGWVTPVLRLGTRKTIDSGDLYCLDTCDRPLSIWRRYTGISSFRGSLIKRLGVTFAPQLLAQGLLALGNSALEYGGPFFLQRILHSIRMYNTPGQGESRALVVASTSRLIYLDAIGLLLCSLLHSVMVNQVLWIGRRVSVRLQGLLVAELSSKALRRRCKTSAPPKEGEDKEDKTASSDGRVANMLTSDLESIGHISSYLNEIYTLPIKFVLGSWYLYSLLGVSALIGLTITVVYYPLTKLMVKYLIKYQKRLRAIEDERVTMITEMFQGIRAVKLFGWQSRFIERVRSKRTEELALYWRLMLLQLPVSFVQSITTSLMLICILALYSLVFGHPLTADIVFPTITVFFMVSGSFNSAPGMFRWLSSCYVSLKRIESFMVLSPVQDLDERVDDSSDTVGFVDANFEWSPPDTNESKSSASSVSATPVASSGSLSRKASVATDLSQVSGATEETPLLAGGSSSSIAVNDSPAEAGLVRFTLRDISLRFPAGGLSIVVGPTGSGKSSLLSALIGEMTLTSGRVLLPSGDALALDAELAGGKYREIVELSGQGRVMRDIAYVAQEAWLRNATIRDNILFGESYDQQRYEEVLRVCALKPDLRILDAGDRTEIGERGVTLSGGQKQRVALARAVYSSRKTLLIDDCLSAVDAHTAKHILMECLLGQTPLMQGRTRVLVTHHVAACLPYADYVALIQDGRVSACGAPDVVQIQGLELNPAASQAEGDVVSSADANDMRSEDDYASEAVAVGVLVDDEEREQGYVRLSVWLDYMRMCGPPWYWATVIGLMFINRATSIIQDYSVRLWMSASDDASAPHTVAFWLTLYLLTGLLSTAVNLTDWVNEGVGALRAGRRYHERLFARVISATPRFFDKTPIGRVISRFSRDMRTIDGDIINEITGLVSQLTHMVSVFAIISVVTPPFVLIAVVMTLAYARLGVYYLNATRELKRLDSISMAPLLSLFSELITGVESIRAFGAMNQYTMEAMNRVDVHNRPYYLLWAANRWLCSRIELLGCLVAFSTTILILFSLDTIDAGLAGFVLMYAISFSDYMLWFIRNYCDCEISMNSVERVTQYLALDQEAPMFIESAALPSNWPATGHVQVENLVVEYVPGTPVLRGLSFAVKSGEKIGVVGRTGAGKSTLSLAFLRFIEPAQGGITLDGVDISTIGLEDLRRNVTIIPQDPVLFNGTIRFNLDPFTEYSDALLWDALRRSHLVHDGALDGGDRMSGIFKSLEAEIKENGQNLSLGQRQLVALARALVRRSRLIIMDEATASVDFDTDDRIQRTIRGAEFADSTLFCIAHRLRTIIDYDRVLVLDNGQIVEFDSPSSLLQKESGIFKSMCEKSGEYDHLLAAATAAQSKST